MALPNTPVSCSTESNVFMGWTIATLAAPTNIAPVVLYTQPADFPAVTENVTYYAVFAKEEIVEYGPELGDVEFTFNTGTSFENNGVSIVFEQANGNTASKYYDPAMRAYAGNTITVTAEGMVQILFDFATGDGSNSISPSVGTFNTNAWIGNADEVVFTIGGSSGNRRIHQMTVSRNDIGGGEINSKYLTNCGDPSDISHSTIRPLANKVLIGDQLYIVVGDHLYDLLGRPVTR